MERRPVGEKKPLLRGWATIDRRGAHVILRGDLRNRQFANVHKRADRTPLAIIELLRSAALAAPSTRLMRGRRGCAPG
jgi:predicted RNA binding protein YcfA (HicA-like mRNA interferase family)